MDAASRMLGADGYEIVLNRCMRDEIMYKIPSGNQFGSAEYR